MKGLHCIAFDTAGKLAVSCSISLPRSENGLMVENNNTTLDRGTEDRILGCYSKVIRDDNEEIRRPKDRKGPEPHNEDRLRAGVGQKV